LQAAHGWYTKGVLHNGTHWFDLLRFLFGEVAAVSARPAGEMDEHDGELDVDLRLTCGARAKLTSCSAGCFTVFEMDALLEKGRLELRDATLTARLSRARPSERFAGHTELYEETCPFGDSNDALLRAVEDLASAVVEGRDPACTGADGVAALAIGEAALTSAGNGGRWVELAKHEGGGAGSLR